MAKKKKLTKLQSEYEKNRRRIQRYINKYKKLGYEIDVKVPDRPSRVTQKQLRLIKEITPKYIQSKSVVPDPTTGEVLTGTEYQKRARAEKRAQREGAGNYVGSDINYSDAPITNHDDSMEVIYLFQNSISKLPPKTSAYLQNALNSAMQSVDPEDLAYAIKNASAKFKDLTDRLMYDSIGAAAELSSTILNLIPNISRDLRDELEYDFYSYEWSPLT